MDEERGADLGILLTLALRSFVDLLHAELTGRGFGELRPPFGVVFRALRDKPLTLTEVASRLAVTKQSAAKIVDEMAAKELLRRTGSTTDGRAKLLELTDRGRAAMATAILIGADIDNRLRAAAGSTEVDVLHRVLEQFVVLAGLSDDLARRRAPAVWDQL